MADRIAHDMSAFLPLNTRAHHKSLAMPWHDHRLEPAHD